MERGGKMGEGVREEERRVGGVRGKKGDALFRSTFIPQNSTPRTYSELLLKSWSTMRIFVRKYRTSWNVGSIAETEAAESQLHNILTAILY